MKTEQQEVLDIAKLLAGFMGGEPLKEIDPLGWWRIPNKENKIGYDTIMFNYLLFNKDWNLLMKVVDIIESIEIDNRFQYMVNISHSDCIIVNKDFETVIEFINERSKINAVYFACVDFVKWYNKKK